MDQVKVGIIVAMPEELNPLLRRIGRSAREKLGLFTGYRFEVAGRETCIIAAGMGTANAATAARTMMEFFRPHVLVSAGFAGGITPAPRVGDVVLAERILALESSTLKLADWGTMDAKILSRVTAALATQQTTNGKIHKGTFVTASGILNKKALASLLPDDTVTAVVEMESAAVARIAADSGVAFVGVRTISDAADEELGFSIEEFTDERLTLRITRVLATIVRKPWIIPQLLRLASNSRIAGRNLATALTTTIRSA